MSSSSFVFNRERHAASFNQYLSEVDFQHDAIRLLEFQPSFLLSLLYKTELANLLSSYEVIKL